MSLIIGKQLIYGCVNDFKPLFLYGNHARYCKIMHGINRFELLYILCVCFGDQKLLFKSILHAKEYYRVYTV